MTLSSLRIFYKSVLIILVCIVITIYLYMMSLTIEPNLSRMFYKRDEATSKPSSLKTWMRERSKVYEKRRKRVRDVCKSLSGVYKTNIDAGRNQSDNIYLSHTGRLLGCLINKAASSSLMVSFLKLDGLNISAILSPHAYVTSYRSQNESELKMGFSFYKTFSFVRHPLDRLASCYMDKLVNMKVPSLTYLRENTMNIGQEIIKKGNKKVIVKERPLDSSGKKTATFQEFLEFILSESELENGYSHHWKPYYLECSFCYHDYEIIGKLETAYDDFMYLWSTTDLMNHASIPWANKNEHSSKKKLLKMLPRELLIDIYRRYKPDFQMFGYDMSKTLTDIGYETLRPDEE